MRFLAFLLLILTALPAAAGTARLKDLVSFDGVRSNDLVGYGLIVGLSGTGDSLKNSPFTEEIMTSTLERLGVNVTGEQIKSKNVATVIITASLPPFARIGATIDVTVSAIGDATSLLGGTLVMTPLKAADGEIYAVAQGSIIAGGVEVSGEAASVSKGVASSGTIPGGARVEREVQFALDSLQTLRISLRNPDFTTAAQIESVVNRAIGRRVASMLDAGTVGVDLRGSGLPSAGHFIARIENLEVEPRSRAKVVMDQRSGTIVIGEYVRIGRIAVSQGNITLRVSETPLVAQPNPFSAGDTVVVPRTAVDMQEGGGEFVEVESVTTLSEVVAGLNALGVSPRDMMHILSTIDAAGALYAELIVR